MGFSAVVICEIGKEVSPFAYPETDVNGNLIEEKYDHGLNHKVTATGIYYYKRPAQTKSFQEVMIARDVEIEVYITDSRVVIRCPKYDKGDRKWSGGLTALALNAYEKSKAKRRSAGKILLGHVRYEWLRQILYVNFTKTKWLETDDHTLRLFYEDTDETAWIIDLKFDKGTDTAFLANEIVHRLSKYRLAMTNEIGEDLVQKYQKFTSENITPDPNPKEFSAFSSGYSYLAPGGKDVRPKW